MDGNRVRFSFKEQTVKGTPAVGAGAYAIDVVPSQGLQQAVAEIASRIQRRSRMMLKSRAGSRAPTFSAETEVMTGAGDKIVRAVLGSEDGVKVDLDQTTLTQLTITGSGTILTFTGGNLLTSGLVFGSTITLGGMSVAANNDVPTPVLNVSANGRVVTVPTGYLLDNVADVAFTVRIHKQYHTPADGYIDRYYTTENYYDELEDGDGNSKLMEWARFNSLQFGITPDNYASMGFGLVGRQILPYDAADTPPLHTDPTYAVEEARGLTFLDGALWVDGVREINIDSLTFGIAAQGRTKAIAGDVISPVVSLGSFKFAGNFARLLEDLTNYAKFDENAQVRMLANFGVPGAPTKFVNIAAGDLSFGPPNDSIGGEDALVEQIPLYGGEDPTGAGYAASTLVYSTSAADDA